MSQEFRLSSPASSIISPLKWLTGSYLFYNRSPTKQGIHIGENGDLAGAEDKNFTSINTNWTEGYGLALFGQGTYNLSSNFRVTFGIRYDYEYKNQRIRAEYMADEAEVILARSDTSTANGFSNFSPKVGAEYQFCSNSNVYFNYSRGFRAGGISQLSGDAREALQIFDPENSDNWEVGSKNTFLKNKLQLNVALFSTSVGNAQVPTLLLPEAIIVTRNAGKLHSRGVEVELRLKPLKQIEFNYNMGYTHARYEVLTIPVDGTAKVYENSRQIFTPDITSGLSVDFTSEINRKSDLKLTGHIEWRRIGDQYFDLANRYHQPDYDLLNANIGIQIKKMSFVFYGKNLADQVYVDYAYDFGAAHLGNSRIYGLLIRTLF